MQIPGQPNHANSQQIAPMQPLLAPAQLPQRRLIMAQKKHEFEDILKDYKQSKRISPENKWRIFLSSVMSNQNHQLNLDLQEIDGEGHGGPAHQLEEQKEVLILDVNEKVKNVALNINDRSLRNKSLKACLLVDSDQESVNESLDQILLEPSPKERQAEERKQPLEEAKHVEEEKQPLV